MIASGLSSQTTFAKRRAEHDAGFLPYRRATASPWSAASASSTGVHSGSERVWPAAG